MATQQILGQHSEQAACRYLTDQGCRLICKNYRCRFGEIDLIMQDQEYLIFVEVRYRRNLAYGGSLQSITRSKQKKIIKTAQHYLNYHPTDDATRFDVIAFNGQQLTWIKNAFLDESR